VIGLAIANASAAENADWFGQRLFDAFAKDVQSTAYEAPPPDAAPSPRRIPAAPFDSPPFPSGDWQIGGTPIIGDPGNLAPWPLMEAIYAGPNGEAWKKSRIQIYGWEDFSWNVSTSTNTSRGPNANFPLIYDLRPNRFEQKSSGGPIRSSRFVPKSDSITLTTQTRMITGRAETNSPLRWI
jgi:hypothetical protein